VSAIGICDLWILTELIRFSARADGVGDPKFTEQQGSGDTALRLAAQHFFSCIFYAPIMLRNRALGLKNTFVWGTWMLRTTMLWCRVFKP